MIDDPAVSAAEAARRDLQDAGHYLIRANVGWFAVFPDKLTKLRKAAGGDNFSFVIYGTRTDARDHHVVPAGVLTPLLTTEALANVHSGGTRWNCTLKHHTVRVTNARAEVDVGRFHRLPLPSEGGEPFGDAVGMRREFHKAVTAARRLPARELEARLAAAPAKPERVRVVATEFRRNPDMVAFVLKRAAGVCEQCGAPAPFARVSDDSPYLEVHHDVRLADGGDDSPANARALCPNCHRNAHHRPASVR